MTYMADIDGVSIRDVTNCKNIKIFLTVPTAIGY